MAPIKSRTESLVETPQKSPLTTTPKPYAASAIHNKVVNKIINGYAMVLFMRKCFDEHESFLASRTPFIKRTMMPLTSVIAMMEIQINTKYPL